MAGKTDNNKPPKRPVSAKTPVKETHIPAAGSLNIKLDAAAARSAVVLSEIIGKPVSKRRRQR